MNLKKILEHKTIDNIYINKDLIIKELTNNNYNAKFGLNAAIFLYTNSDAPEIVDQSFIPQILKKIVYKKIKDKASEKINNYYVNIVNSQRKKKMFLLHLIFYSFSAKLKKNNSNIGIDFEFNKGKIALCQVCLFAKKTNYIWIFDPRDFNHSDEKNILINYMFAADKINKILHGADTLDVPFMYSWLNNKKQIIKFTKNLYDTRFMCEYYKNFVKFTNNKCSIYDALLYFKVITQETYNMLENITKKMPPIWKTVWDVNKMDNATIKYALYDVYYLEGLFAHIIKVTDDINKNVIPELTQLVYLHKANIFNHLSTMKKTIDSINNETMINIYNRTMEKLNVENLFNINYFKSSLTIIFKYIIYSKNKQLDTTFIMLHLKELELTHLYKFLEGIINKIVNLLIK